jgi:hypothetical protein
MGDDKPITGREILEALRSSEEPSVRKALDTGNVQMASADRVQGLQPWIDRILKANDISSAWVSDRSNMGDFIGGDKDGREAQRLEIAKRLGHDFQLNERVVDVAAALRAAEAPLPN